MSPTASLVFESELQSECLKEALENYLEGGTENDDWYHATRELLLQLTEEPA